MIAGKLSKCSFLVGWTFMISGSICKAAEPKKLLARARYDDAHISLLATTVGSDLENQLSVSTEDGRRLHLPLGSGVGLASKITRAYGDLFIVEFSSDAPYKEEVIFDSHSMTVREKITCYSPALSPNRRYLAFTKFFPPHGFESQSMVSNFQMIYDLSKNPFSNRDPRRLQVHDDDQAGILVYPQSWVLPSYKSHPTAVLTFLFVGDPIWSADSSKFVILEEHFPVEEGISSDGNLKDDSLGDPVGTWMPLGLVLVDLSSEKPKVSEKTFGNCYEIGGCNAQLRSASFSPTGVTAVIENGPRGAGDGTVSVGFIDFRPIE